MPETTDLQRVPVKLYRTPDVVTAAAPMPGLEADNFSVEVAADGRLVILGELRGALKDTKEILLDEWSVGPYWREVHLPCAVDGQAATATYGNGVLVVALPVCERMRPAMLRLETVSPTRAVRMPEDVAERRRLLNEQRPRRRRRALDGIAGGSLLLAAGFRRGLVGAAMAAAGVTGLVRAARGAAEPAGASTVRS